MVGGIFAIVVFLSCQTVFSAEEKFDFLGSEKSFLEFSQLDEELQAQLENGLNSESESISEDMLILLNKNGPPKDDSLLTDRIKRLLSFHKDKAMSGKYTFNLHLYIY